MHKPPLNESPEGRYVNYFKVGHNADVFVIDYYQFLPDDDEAEADAQVEKSPKCRLISSPSDAKQLMLHLKSSIKNYEKNFGPIQNGKKQK